MSGNALGPYNNPTSDPAGLARQQAKVLGIEAAHNRDLIARLRSVDARRLVDSIDELKFWSVDPLTLYRPVREATGSAGAFLTEEPQVISQNIQVPWSHQVPWLQGTVQNEGAIRASAILTNDTLLADLNQNFDVLLPKLMELSVDGPAEAARVNELMRRRYFNGAHGITKGNEQKFIDVSTMCVESIHHYSDIFI